MRYIGITIDRWGPCAWNTLHSFAHRTPHNLSIDDRERTRLFIYLFAEHLPCPTCRNHFRQFLEENANENTFATRDTIVRLLHDAHNSVNVRLGKRAWTFEQHVRAYSRPGDVPHNPYTAGAAYVVGVATVLGLAMRSYRQKNNLGN